MHQRREDIVMHMADKGYYPNLSRNCTNDKNKPTCINVWTNDKKRPVI